MNMTHKFGKKFSLTGSVNYNLNRNGNLSSIYQEQYLPAGNQYSASTNESNSKGRSISSNFMGSWEVDKRTRIHFTGNLESLLIGMKTVARMHLLMLLPA